VVRLYINTGIQSIDQDIMDAFNKYVCQAEEESTIAVVSRKTVLPGDIERLAQGGRKIILLVDSGDRDLIRAAKQAEIKDLFFSPVKIDSIEKRISEIITEMQDVKESIRHTGEQTEARQKVRENNCSTEGATVSDKGNEAAAQEDSLDELLACIRSRVGGSEELEALRRENEWLKSKLKRYEDFVAVLAEIFQPQTNKGAENR